MTKLIVLDFDGVIVESVDIKTEAFRTLFKDYPHADDIYQYHLENNALSRFVKFKHIYERILGREYNEEIGEELSRQYSEIVFNGVVDCPMVSGAEEFLKTLSETYPIYLVSATPQVELEKIIVARNLRPYFREVCGVPPGNKVDLIKQAMINEGVRAEDTVYIGDMREDFRIAQETGVLFLGRRSRESLEGLGVPVFDEMKGAMEWLQNRAEAAFP